VDGASGQGAGIIILKAFTVKAEGATSLSASNDNVVELPHNIYIAAHNLVSSDNAADLFSIAADGSKNAAVILVPVNGMTEYSNMTASGLDFGVTFPNGVPGATGSLNIAGEGKFNLSAEGDLAYIALGGSVNLSQTDDFDVTAKGSGNIISLGYNGENPSGATLTFGGGKVTLTADGNETQANTIFVYGNDVPAQADDVTLKSNGASGGTNNGGNIFVSLTGASVIDKFTISANGGPSGGDGGTITVDVPSGAVNVPGVFSVNAPDTGKGGTLTITADEANLTAARLSADAEVEGDGGTVSLTVENALSIDPTSLISAIAGSSSGNGKGGTVSITGNGGFAVDSANIAATAQGSGKGGAITLKAPAHELAFSGDLNANGGDDNGEGGSIEFDVGTLALPEPSNTRIKANGHGTGKGGLLKVTAAGDITVANGNGTLSLEARNVDATDNNLNGDADGGTIDLTTTGALDLYSGAIAVSGGQRGGTLKAKGAEVILSGDFYADGGAQGDGGSITFEANSLTLPAEVNTIIAANGNGSGKGGDVTLKTSAQGITVSTEEQTVSIQAKSNESGDGGSVIINSTLDINPLGTAIDVSAGIGSKGTGGNITVAADGDLTVSGYLNANGGCDEGDGGQISLTGNIVSTSGTIEANSGSESCLAIAAKSSKPKLLAGPTLFSAGIISIHAGDKWVADGSPAIHADAKVGQSKGGLIIIETTNPVIMNPLANGSITARGLGNGEGGRVSVTNAQGILGPLSQAIEVNRIIQIASGLNAGIGVSGGSIQLNGIEVFRHNTGNATWPTALWSVNSSPSTTDNQIEAAAFSLPSGMRAVIAAGHYELYAFFDTAGLDQFFHITTSDELGVTNPISKTVSVMLDRNSYWEETAIHEAGHALDFVEAELSLSPSFLAAMDSEKANFNGQACNVVFAGTTVCTDPRFSSNTNWERFLLAVVESSDPHEVFAQLFAYKGAYLDHGYQMEPKDILMFGRTPNLNTYMTNLWALY